MLSSKMMSEIEVTLMRVGPHMRRKVLRAAQHDAKANGIDLTGLTVSNPGQCGVWAVWIDSYHRGMRPIWRGVARTATEAKVLGIYTRISKKRNHTTEAYEALI